MSLDCSPALVLSPFTRMNHRSCFQDVVFVSTLPFPPTPDFLTRSFPCQAGILPLLSCTCSRLPLFLVSGEGGEAGDINTPPLMRSSLANGSPVTSPPRPQIMTQVSDQVTDTGPSPQGVLQSFIGFRRARNKKPHSWHYSPKRGLFQNKTRQSC